MMLPIFLSRLSLRAGRIAALLPQIEPRRKEPGKGEEPCEEPEGRAVAAGLALHDGEEERPRDARHAPRGEDDAVDGREVAHAEEVRQVRGHAGEAAAVAADDEEHPRGEGRRIGRPRKLPEGEDFDGEEKDVHRAAADPVGDGGPEDAPRAVHDADDAHEGRGPGGAHADDFLRHGRRHGEETDAAGDVREEDPPERGEFRRLHRFPAGVLLLRDRRGRSGELFLHHGVDGVGHFARAGRREVERGRAHDEGVGAGHEEEILREAVRGGEALHDRPGDEGGEAEAHDGEACCEAPVAREPFHEGRHRRDIPRAEADAADESVEEIEERETLPLHRPRGSEEPRHEEEHGQEPRPARPEALHHVAEEARGETEEKDGDGEGPCGLREREPHGVHDGAGEHAPRVHAPDGDVDAHGGESDEPAISFHKKIPLCECKKGAPPDAPGMSPCPDGRLAVRRGHTWSFPLFRQRPMRWCCTCSIAGAAARRQGLTSTGLSMI